MKNFLEIDQINHKFVGFLTIKGNFFKIHLTLPEHPLAANSKLEVFDLAKKITLELPPDPAETAQDYVNRLEKYLKDNKCEETSKIHEIVAGVERLQEILNQLDKLETSGHTVEISDDYSRIKISGMTENQFHFMEFAVTETAQVKVINHSLPAISGEMFWKIGTIDSHLTSFHAHLNQFSEFYDNMHTIDELCFVVGPVNITTKTTSRIIKFSDKIFLRIRLDPVIPSQITLNFIGPIGDIEPLREIYDERIADWDGEMDVHKNLLRMYDLIYFPMRDDSEETPCNICFDHLQGNAIPIISCDNAKCNVIFHLQCLSDYFATLRSSKTMFSLAMGHCPFCRQKLTTFLQFAEQDD